MSDDPQQMKSIFISASILCWVLCDTNAILIPNVQPGKGKPQRATSYGLEIDDDCGDCAYHSTPDRIETTSWGTKTYCEFLAHIRSPSRYTCTDNCEWWKYYTDAFKPESTCSTFECDVDGNMPELANNAPCHRKSNYIITAPILHRPSGLLQPEMCECLKSQGGGHGESCQKHEDVTTTSKKSEWSWCFLKSEKGYCRKAYDPSGISGTLKAATASTRTTDDCVGETNVKTVQDTILRSWNLGVDEDYRYHEDTLYVTYHSRSRFFEAHRNGPNTRVEEDYIIDHMGYMPRNTAWDRCAQSGGSGLVLNLFAVHVPECRDADDFFDKSRSKCTSFISWQKTVIDNMDSNKFAPNDKIRLISTTKVRFQLPEHVVVELYSDGECRNAVSVLHRGSLPTIATAPDLTGYSWRFSRTDEKRCLSSSVTTNDANGYCSVTGSNKVHAIVADWVPNAQTPFACGERVEGNHYFRADHHHTDNVDFPTCGMRYKQWKECPANMHANAVLDNCEFCEAATPSRPTSTSHCVACGSGQWFPNWRQAGSACDFLEVVVYEKGTDAQGTGWKIQKGSDITGVALSHLNYYAASTDQTIRNRIPKGWYMSYSAQKAELTQCVNKQDEEDYMYRNNCGAQEHDTPLTGYDPWFYRNGVYFKKDDLPVGIHQIAMGGNKMRCLDCNNDSNEGSYNSNCKANQPQIASNCVACKLLSECVAQDSYLDHFYTGDGCKNPDAVTDTECKKCPVIRVRGPDSHNIVVGCGRTALSRWNDETGEIGDEDGPVMCGYKDSQIATPTTAAVFIGDSPKCTYMGKELEQSNNYDEGRTRTLPTDIPYCPPGYWIDVNKAGCITDEWKTTWIHACCRPCRGCKPHEKKMDGFQKCAGNKHIDTEASQCNAMCPTGYWNDETNANTDSAGTCVKCKTSCSS